MTPDREKALRRNVLLLDIVRPLRMALIAMPVIVLFWNEVCGIGPLGVFALQGIFAVVVTVCEVPSGYLSDRLGRRRTLMLATVLALLGWLLYGLSRSFWQLAVVEVVLGLSISAWSGTDAALLYETIAELGLDEQALHHESRNLFLSQATESLASVLGGYLAVWISLRATVWATAAPYAASLLLVGMLTEPTRRSSDQSATLRQAWGYLRDAFSDVELRRLMLGGGLLAAGTLVAVWLHQFLWLRADLARPLFGWSWAALNLAVAFSALVSPWLHERLGTRGALGLLGLWSAATFVGLGVWISPWVVVVGCALNLVRGVGHPIVVTGINQQVTDDRRATALSTYSLMARLIFVLFGPVVGWVAMAHGLTPACLLTCLLGIGAMLVVRPFSSKLST